MPYEDFLTGSEPLPDYVEGQIPQSPFDALLTRIIESAANDYEGGYMERNLLRRTLNKFVEEQKAPTYTAGQKSEQEGKKDIEEESKHDKKTADLPDHDKKDSSIAPPQPSAGPSSVLNVSFGIDLSQKLIEEASFKLLKQHIILEFFNSISREDTESITLLIQHNLVTANTTNKIGCTPLLAAIASQNGGNLALVITLLDLGADPNAFSPPPIQDRKYFYLNEVEKSHRLRTPLMLAAHLGSLPIVKVLMEPPYNANDALVAPDGQIALRLAVAAGHRHIVEYLPARRAGGWVRFRVHHAKAIKRISDALLGIFEFFKFVLWHVPKFFLWSIPKHLIVRPVVKSAKWCWERRGKFGGWCKKQITALPGRVKRGLKKTWVFGTQTLPKAVKDTVIWIWEFFTKKVPKAIAVLFKWIWRGITSIARGIYSVAVKFLSLLHTTFVAIISFLRSVTLKDILTGITTLLRAVFISLPSTVLDWIQQFGEVSCKVLTALFGGLGELIWLVGYGLYEIARYLPLMLIQILKSLVGSIGKGFHEIWIWISPKA